MAKKSAIEKNRNLLLEKNENTNVEIEMTKVKLDKFLFVIVIIKHLFIFWLIKIVMKKIMFTHI